MKLVIWTFAAASAFAQTELYPQPWFFDETLRAATDVVVADVVSGTAEDAVNVVRVKASVRVLRTLSGAAAPGAQFQVEWEYGPAPGNPPAVTMKVSPDRGLWFFRRSSDDRLEPLRAAYMMPVGAGRYLPAAANAPACAANDPLHVKLAREFEAAMVEIAPRVPESRQDRTRFQALAMAARDLDPAATQALYVRLSAFADPCLKTVGLTGRLITDGSALLEIERNLPLLAPVWNDMRLPFVSVAPKLDPVAAHALGRIALAETTAEALEQSAPLSLGHTDRPEYLPYLVTMLGSPTRNLRASAVFAICSLVKRTRWWQPSLAANCPEDTPQFDRGEQRIIAFWREWWERTRPEIAKSVALPQVARPARYDRAPEPPPAPALRPIESRFYELVVADRAFASRPGPKPPDLVGNQLSGHDRVVWREAVEGFGPTVDSLWRKADDLRNAARVAGTKPTAAQGEAYQAEVRGAAKAALDALRPRMTAAGWDMVEWVLSQDSIRTDSDGKVIR